MEIGRLPLNGKNVGTARHAGLLWENEGLYELCQTVSNGVTFRPLLRNCFGISPEIACYPGHCATETKGHDIFRVNPCVLEVGGPIAGIHHLSISHWHWTYQFNMENGQWTLLSLFCISNIKYIQISHLQVMEAYGYSVNMPKLPQLDWLLPWFKQLSHYIIFSLHVWWFITHQ